MNVPQGRTNRFETLSSKNQQFGKRPRNSLCWHFIDVVIVVVVVIINAKKVTNSIGFV